MTAALRYEWTRLTTLRSTWWLIGASVVVGAGFTFFMAMTLRLTSESEIRGEVDEEFSRFILDGAMTQFSNVDPMFYLLAYVVAMIGILCWGHEYRHGMIRATLTAVPQRGAVFAAKYAVVAAMVAAVVIVSCVLSLVSAVIWFGGLDLEWDLPYLVLALFKRIVYSILLTWLVMSVTVLVRHQTFSLLLLYLWPLGIESMAKVFFTVMSGITGDDETYALSRFLPFNAGGRIMQNYGADGLQENLDLFGDPMSAWGGFILFGGLTFALMAVAMVSFDRRDA